MKHPRFLAAVLGAALLAAPLRAAGPDATPETAAPEAKAAPAAPNDAAAATLLTGAGPLFPLAEVKRGQRGYGLSVFAGTEPERFEVEVLGVLRNLNPDLSYIMARLTGQGLEKIGVAGGMSGSPVYIDGKLAGAVAFSWPFPTEALAGITPIESMRKLSTLKAVPLAPPPTPVKVSDLMSGQVPKEWVTAQLSRLQPRFVSGGVPAVRWSTTGFGEKSIGMLSQALGSVGPAGQAAPGSVPDELAPGRSVSVVLVDGDLQLAANGTVTDRYGDHVLAFGHPFLGLGPIRVPMATAEVVTVFSSSNSSFKVSNAGRIVGAFEQDRQAGIQGRIGAVAPMVPMTIRVRGEGGGKPQELHMRLADLQEFMPLLVGSSLLGSLESTTYSTGSQTLDLSARLRLARYGDLEVRQSFQSENAGTDAAAYLLSIVSYLTQNSLEKVAIQSVEVELSQSSQPTFASLVGATADRSVVRPGQRVTVNLDLAAYRGERFGHTLTLDLPKDLPAGRYSLLVGDGASADAARLALEPSEPVTFPQALEMMRSFHSRRDVLVLGVYGKAGLSVAGEVMPSLPGSVRSLWGASGSGSSVALKSAIAQVKREPMGVPVQGLVRIDLEVRRKEPVAGQDDGGEPAATGNAAVDSAGKGSR